MRAIWMGFVALTGCGGGEPAQQPRAPEGGPASAPERAQTGPPGEAKHCPPPAAVPCSKDGWCWDNPRPHGMLFEHAWGDAERLVAIGGGSMLAVRPRREGGWQYYDSGSVLRLESIHGAGDSVYIGGRGGTLLRFRAGCFERIDAGTQDDLFGVWTDGHVLMASGQGRVHMHRDGAWSKLEVPGRPSLFSLFARSPEDVIAGDGAGNLHRYQGGQWSSRSQSDRWFHALHGAPSGPVYAAGSASHLAVLDGAEWRGLDRRVDGKIEDWYGVWSAPGVAVAVGLNGGVATLEGEALPPIEGVTAPRWSAVWGSGSDDITVMGSHVARLTGKSGRWQLEHDPRGVTVNLEGIGGIDDERVIVVGWEGTILQRDGARGWRTMRSTGKRDDYLRDVWVRRADHAWVVGANRNLLEWDGKEWHQRATDDTPSLNAIWNHGSELAYAVGGGSRKHPSVMRSDGNRWTPVEDAPRSYWHDVWGSGPNDVYLTGHAGVAHFDGGQWRMVDEAKRAFPEARRATHYHVQGVWGSSARDVFVTLAEGGVLHFDGSAWRYTEPREVHLKHGLPSDGGPDEIFGAGRDVWSVSNHGLIHRFNGEGWKPESSATSSQLSNVWTSDKAVYALGSGGTIMRRVLPSAR